MRRLLAILALLSCFACAEQPRAVEALREFEKMARQPLWPGFEPQHTAVELFDGMNTYLFHHPKPPEGFQPVEGAAGVFVFAGQHDSVRANTGTEVNGVPTATADISKSKATVRDQAALLVHETFHVYQKKAHPKWAANEGELFLYPFDDAEALALRRLETLALLRALHARSDREVRCWSEAAMRLREQRFRKMPPGAAAYERGVELNEGLAQYVEYKAARKHAALAADDFPAELIRQRGYATGQALALLLDRFVGKKWREAGDAPLDARLNAYFDRDPQRPRKLCSFAAEVAQQELDRAQAERDQLVSGRAKRKQEFLAAEGWRIEIIAGKEPLWPQGFDPWNVRNLGNAEVLHTRWMKVGNKSGELEVLNHASLTEGVGPHPLFNGTKRLVVTGLGPVSLDDKDGRVAVAAPGVKGSFRGASVTNEGQAVVIRLP
ncbi:MAG TPA: hypothetical protein VLA96_05990 [Terriglobales bacterium]|nr:hypothetical protein [Terriglobales bacterium]